MLLVRGLYVVLDQPDPASNISLVIIAIEANLSIITASAPALRPLLRAWFPSSSSSSSKSGRGGSGMTAVTRQQSAERRNTTAVSAATDKMVLGAGAAARIGRLRSAASSSRRSDDESPILPARGDVTRTDFVAQYRPPTPRADADDAEEEKGVHHLDKEVVNIGLENGARREAWV